jgi:hypothetical protein
VKGKWAKQYLIFLVLLIWVWQDSLCFGKKTSYIFRNATTCIVALSSHRKDKWKEPKLIWNPPANGKCPGGIWPFPKFILETCQVPIDSPWSRRNFVLRSVVMRQEILLNDTVHQGKHCDQVEIQVHPTVTLGSGVPERVSILCWLSPPDTSGIPKAGWFQMTPGPTTSQDYN